MGITKENIEIFFQPDYFFNPYPGYDIKFAIPLLAFFVTLLFLSLLSVVIIKKNKKRIPQKTLWNHIYNWLFWTGIVGLIFLFFRYEGTPYLAMRAFLFVLLVVFLIWPVYIIVFYFRRYKKMLKELKEKEEKEKYFRKIKNRK